jgi:hypothetical protein
MSLDDRWIPLDNRWISLDNRWTVLDGLWIPLDDAGYRWMVSGSLLDSAGWDAGRTLEDCWKATGNLLSE